MKATGIVRRIDDLGRVVIPKEIRRTMRIREGDPLEIFTDRDGEVIFKKYSPIGELGDFAAQICDSLRKTTDGIAAVCDRDAVIAVAVAAPILSEGDVLGCVLFVAAHGDGPAGETERKLAQAVSGFLGKQMES